MGAPAIGLVETYDLDQAVDSSLANISTRGLVETGDNVMIGGIIVGPDGAAQWLDSAPRNRTFVERLWNHQSAGRSDAGAARR